MKYMGMICLVSVLLIVSFWLIYLRPRKPKQFRRSTDWQKHEKEGGGS